MDLPQNQWGEVSDDGNFSSQALFAQILAHQLLRNRETNGGEYPQPNEQRSAIASSAHTANEVTSPFVNIAAGGLTLFLNITVNAAAEALFLTLEGKDSISSDWVELEGSPVLNTAATGLYAWQPAAPLPRYWRVGVYKSAGNSVTYSLSYSYTRTAAPAVLVTPWDYSNQSGSAQTDTPVIAAVAGQRHRITDIYFAAKAAVDVTIEQGTGTFKWRYYAAAASDGATYNLVRPITLAVNTAVTYTTSGTA